MRRAFAVVLAASVVGCASTKPTAARREVADIVGERGGPRDAIPALQDEKSRAQVRERVADLLAKPLTIDRALQIAVTARRWSSKD